jgi:hypothetical protein
MKYLLISVLAFAGPLYAETAVIDANGSVISFSKGTLTAQPNTTVITPSSWPADTTSDAFQLYDSNGRCKYQASDAGPMTLRATPRWPAGAALKVGAQKALWDRIDVLDERIAGLREWQTTMLATKDRQAELDAAISARQALVDIATGN